MKITADTVTGVKPDTYLGDGLYASWDGYQIRLYTQRLWSDQTARTHEVFLDGSVLAKFEQFVAELRANTHNAAEGEG